MAELQVGQAFTPNLRGSTGQGVVQVTRGDTDLSLWGSVNGTDYVLIETFTASSLKEVILCSFFKISGNAADIDAAAGTSKLWIDETRGG